MSSFSSPTHKRKRTSFTGEPDTHLQIPPTPPTSSPAKTEFEMRHTTGMNGVQVLIPDADMGSPRTKVAYHFQGLQLEDGGDVSKLSLDTERSGSSHLPTKGEMKGTADGPDESAVRKRVRVFESSHGSGLGLETTGREIEIPETPAGKLEHFGITFGPERTIDPMIEERARQVTLHNEVDPVIFKSGLAAKVKTSALSRAYPSINRLSDSKSRGKPRRTDTMPLSDIADASIEISREAEGQRGIVDPERAALTWHDNEITGHDPSDPEDDGEGINGIGFRPTAAEAYQRTQRRKQQMAEYKSREAKEARARRQERRREMEEGSREEKEVERRVRFIEEERKSVRILG